MKTSSSDLPAAQTPRLTPHAIVLVYVIASATWLVLSTVLLNRLVADDVTRARLELMSAGLYVLATAILLLFLIRQGLTAIKQSEQALRESEEQFRQLAEHVQEVFWLSDLEHLLYISPIYQEVWGRPCPEARRRPGCWLEAAHPEDRVRVQKAFARRMHEDYDQHYRIVRPDGSLRWIWERAYRIRDDQGQVYRICGIAQDITPQVLAEQTLAQNVEERTREIAQRHQVAESLRNMLAVLNSDQPLDAILDHIVAEASAVLRAEAVAIYRLHEEEGLLTIQTAQGLEPGYMADARIPVGQSVTGQAVLEQRPVTLCDVTAVSSDDALPLDRQRRQLLERLGTRYRALVAVPLVTDQIYGAITLYYQQPRTFAQEDVDLAVAFGDQAALAIQNAQLRAQVEEQAVASERRRLARDLHDSVTQVLFSASLTAEVLPMVWQRDRAEGQRALEDLRQLTRGALAEMRALLLELRPMALRDARLDELLHLLAEATVGRARVPVTVDVQEDCDLPPEVRVALYRIAQEALNNVAKHAEAGQAMISLQCTPAATMSTTSDQPAVEVRLCVSDDGEGFDLDDIAPEHLGLSIMRERAEAIGATLSIDSRPGQGTQVMITWPTDPDDQG